MPKYQSLHSHTTRSDGKLSSIELLDSAKRNNIDTIAFTDHDSLMDPESIDMIKSHEVRWISGIEMSSGLPKDVGVSPDGPHIVGLFVDPTNENLRQYCKKAQAARSKLMEERVVKLQELGFKISVEDCLKASNGETVGRPHIVQALSFHEENTATMLKLVNQMRDASATNEELRNKYEQMIERGPTQYPYVLFLSEDSFIKGINGQREYWEDFDSCVRLIREAGGLAFFAHYSTERKKISIEKLTELVKEKRIDGVETVYGLWEQGSPRESEIESDRSKIREVLSTHKSLASGGADIHSYEDIVKFSSNSKYSQETIGMIENIISKTSVDKKWSNL